MEHMAKVYEYFDQKMIEYKIEDWSTVLDNQGWAQVSNEFYLLGLYRSGCGKIYCFEYALTGKGPWGKII